MSGVRHRGVWYGHHRMKKRFWTVLVGMDALVCDAVQFTAAGGGGGPYTWSVESDGLEDVAEIDEEGVLTALAPGSAFVTATAGATIRKNGHVH